ncbi:MAG: PLP-dependent cysteine synthase family protein [Limisphaerales bacterium]
MNSCLPSPASAPGNVFPVAQPTATSKTPVRPRPLPPAAAALFSLIGNTPMIPLRFAEEGVTIFAKCEFLNPSGSIKDRLAKTVLTDAWERGLLQPDTVVLECTSGNTGIALSMAGAALGVRVAILMSASASGERRQLIRRLGAELILFESEGRYQTGIEMSREMAARDPRYFLPRQFENPLNVEDHEHATGQEILRQVNGPVDAFVTGFGTGGTLAGCGKAIKARWPQARIIAMEPAEQALLAGECPCCHCIEGVADGFVPALLRGAPLDGSEKVTSRAALEMARRLHREFGLLVGTSSGANVVAALRLARQLGPQARVVTLLCDRAERYFSTSLFADDPAH